MTSLFDEASSANHQKIGVSIAETTARILLSKKANSDCKEPYTPHQEITLNDSGKIDGIETVK
jgi:hypothetical protein